MKKYDVLAIGELNVDMILTGLKVLPELGREIIAEGCSLVLGSSTAICASGISQLGMETGFLSKVGKDMYGRIALDGLEANGVKTDNVIIDENIGTGLTIALNMNGDRALVTYMGSIDALEFEDIDLELVRQARHIHVGSFFLQHRLRPGLPRLFKAAREMGVTTSLDCSWDETLNWDYGLSDVLENTDIFFPNESEALNITGTNTVEEAIEALSKKARIVVVKLGPKGAIGKWDGKVLQQGTFDELKPVDTTGAGDSFNAGFIYGFVKGFDLEKCMTYGNACGSISVTRIGGASACATLKEVEELIAKGR